MIIQRRLSWTALVLCFFVLIAGATPPLSAQQVPDREDMRPAVRVTIGARDDSWVYYTPDQPDFNRVITVLNRAIPVYEQITGITWTRRVNVVYTGSGGAAVIGRMMDSLQAYVTRREPPALFAADPMSCHILIFAGWSAIPDFEAVIARQFFHCFQMEMGAALREDFFDVPLNFWWLQGTAEWAASRVYPELFPSDIHMGFFNPRQDIRRARYDAYFFWEFMSSARGIGSDRNVAIQMNTLRNDGAFPLPFNTNPLDLFHNWAQVLLDRQLPNPPILDLTNINVQASKGGTIQTQMPPFAVDYRSLINFDIQPGYIGVLTVSGMSANNIAVSTRMSGVTQRLQDNTPLEFCPPPDGMMLIMSRAEGGRNSNATLSITWSQRESPNPCTPKPEEDDDDAECIVGNWQVIDYPASVARVDGVEVDTSEFIFSFGADGSLSGAYDIIARADGVTLDLHFPFNGSYALRPLEGNSTQLAVRSWNWTFEAGGSYTATYRDGTQTDFTSQFYAMGGIDLWSPDGTVECSGDTLSWQTADGTGGFAMQRQ